MVAYASGPGGSPGAKGGPGAGKGSEKARAAAEGQRIGAEYSLGGRIEAWNGSKLKGRVIAGWIIIVLAFFAVIGVFQQKSHQLAGSAPQDTAGLLAEIAIVLAVAVPMAVIPPRTKRLWLHHYQEGLAQVTGRRRVSVIRWADLASMSLSVKQGYDDEFIGGCVLRDHAGNEVTVDDRIGLNVSKQIAGRAEQVLVGRLVGPLTDQLDAGVPVTAGCLTVDQRGIGCRGGQPGGRWQLTWPQVSGIESQLSGHRVTVSTGHWGSKRAALAGQPNDFLAAYVLEHAARRAGVPFSAY